MKGLVGFSFVAVIGIYLTAILQRSGYLVATEHLLWVLGAAILGMSVGLLLFDP